MKIATKKKFQLVLLLLVLNIVLRNQVVSNEIGIDSTIMHIMVNSLTEYGSAKWILDPLSYFGLYPASYTSAMHFLLSGISQVTSLDMRWIIYLYCIIIGLFSAAVSYLAASEIYEDDLYKFLTAFAVSVSPAVLAYSTWTIATRGLVVVFTPLFIFLLLRCRKSLKYIPLTVLLGFFLFSAHHLFYFLLPVIFAFLLVHTIFYLNEKTALFDEKLFSKYKYNKYMPLLTFVGFMCMFFIPFFTGKFIEYTRYAPFYISYVRYTGLLIIPAIGGFFYLVFKPNKNFGEWFLIVSLMFLTVFIYEQTYMKWFLPMFIILFAIVGLTNIFKGSINHSILLSGVTLFLLLSVTFSSYYQFTADYEGEYAYIEKYIEDSVFETGVWANDYLTASSTSNDMYFGRLIFSVSDTSHVLTDSMILNNIYGYYNVNISDFKRYPTKSEDFWFSGYEGKDYGLYKWERVQKRWEDDTSIKYFIENNRANGMIVWNHGLVPSPLLSYAHSQNKIYDNDVASIWTLDWDTESAVD